jgi:hypothetical protein
VHRPVAAVRWGVVCWGVLRRLLRRAAGLPPRDVAPVPVDTDEQAAVIARRLALPVEQVALVLDVEYERMVLQGIVRDAGAELHHYPEPERRRVRHSRDLDLAVVAADAERLVGVPRDVALRVLAAELDDLAERGLTGG